jgi:hypothetical protein
MRISVMFDQNRMNVFASADNILDKDFVEARGLLPEVVTLK